MSVVLFAVSFAVAYQVGKEKALTKRMRKGIEVVELSKLNGNSKVNNIKPSIDLTDYPFNPN